LIKKTAPFLFVAGAVLMYTVMHFAKQDPTGFYAKTFYFSAIGLGAAMMLPLAGKARKLNNYFGRAITHRVHRFGTLSTDKTNSARRNNICSC
jgi:hypothetical protein